jgi:predicted phosphodiesterase
LPQLWGIMKYAIISDIHGNLAALEQVLHCIDAQTCDRIICLGDLVGYGPFPNECVRLVREKAAFTLAGNHDHAVLGLADKNDFNAFAKTAIDWTETALSEESRTFLASLELEKSEEDLLFVHATPFNPADWNYIMTLQEADLNFDYFKNRACFIGHSHIPLTFSCNGIASTRATRENVVRFEQQTRYIINVGSVGQSRDGNPKAAFGIFDSENNSFELLRVEYDISATQKAMMALNLPKFLIHRLEHGR